MAFVSYLTGAVSPAPKHCFYKAALGTQISSGSLSDGLQDSTEMPLGTS